MRSPGARPLVLCQKSSPKLDDTLLGGYPHPGRSDPSVIKTVSAWEGACVPLQEPEHVLCYATLSYL